MTKHCLSLFFLLFISSGLKAQLVIDSSTNAGYFVPFTEVELGPYSIYMSCSTNSYPIDLNHDSITDVEFFVSCYMGGQSNENNISISTYNNFYIHSDTNYVMNFQYVGSGGIVYDTSTKKSIVKRYNWGDTIIPGQATLSTNLPIYKYAHGYSPSCTYSNIEPYLGDTAYLVIETTGNELFYIKFSNPYEYRLNLYSINSSDLYLNNIIVYPNPSFETIHFDHPYSKVQILDNFGSVLINELDVYETIDVGTLTDGLYWIHAEDDENSYVTKFIKISH